VCATSVVFIYSFYFFNKEDFISHGSGDWKSKIKAPEDSVFW
jgi:hypothetical protein